MKFPQLYLIVATSSAPPMGIGRNGALPWPSLKNDMAFFARVTQRAEAGMTNAVIMGRKTWESIPKKYRPLAGRLNIVLTKDGKLDPVVGDKAGGHTIVCDSIESAFKEVERRPSWQETPAQVDKVFVIGGSGIYKLAIDQTTKLRGVLPRAVQTSVQKKDGSPFACDTFFPGDFDKGWRKSTQDELCAWVGEHVESGWKDAGDRGGEIDVSITGWEQKRP